jgi:hypothetical protein
MAAAGRFQFQLSVHEGVRGHRCHDGGVRLDLVSLSCLDLNNTSVIEAAVRDTIVRAWPETWPCGIAKIEYGLHRWPSVGMAVTNGSYASDTGATTGIGMDLRHSRMRASVVGSAGYLLALLLLVLRTQHLRAFVKEVAMHTAIAESTY